MDGMKHRPSAWLGLPGVIKHALLLNLAPAHVPPVQH
jgi:hypothetical protein